MNLKGYFVKEVDDFPFFDFPEPWVEETNQCINSRFEIFFNNVFTEYIDSFLRTSMSEVQQDQVVTMDGKGMSTLMMGKKRKEGIA